MAAHFADRLISAIREKSAPVCVGLDPMLDRLPAGLLSEAGLSAGPDGVLLGEGAQGAVADALLTFGRELIQTVAPYVPAIKINIAFFERYNVEGLGVYWELVRHAQDEGLIVIGDVKRADIGHSSTQYAHAHLQDRPHAGAAVPDAVTVNPYFGFDAIRPFVDAARNTGRGLFVLVQTSNESASEVQGVELADGSTLGERVAQLTQSWAGEEALVGTSGYSCIGAVVSPRDLESTMRIRALMPNCLFLVPGFGAQGRTGGQVAKCFKPDGSGAIVNASRSIINAHHDSRYRDVFGDDWRRCVEEACKDFVRTVRTSLPS